ncbi:MAG: hypothetical protein KGJ77_04210 [Acidobacteriota bacterium]|nr:hypothetical protein [Acidobacteriota bacterium]
MWSESFHGDERAGRRPSGGDRVVAVGAACAGLAAIGGEIVLSVQVVSEEFTSRGGSWLLGVVSLFLGLLGPYAAISAWRARRNLSRPIVRRAAMTSLVAACTGALAIAWLLLIHSSLHRPPVLF